jgi:hypothetical protein
MENETLCRLGASALRPDAIWVLHPIRRLAAGPGAAKGGFWGGLNRSSSVRYAHMQGVSTEELQYIQILGTNSSARAAELCEYFRFLFAYTVLMFPGPESAKLVVVQCKGCRENIPAPVEGMPAQPIAARCPLCHEHRRYLPSEVFLGRLSHLVIRKPVRTADGRVG